MKIIICRDINHTLSKLLQVTVNFFILFIDLQADARSNL